MEQQRIGPITPSVHAAGLDPAYVPGLTPPRSDADEAAAAVPEQAGAAEHAPEEEAAAEQPPTRPEAEAEPDADADAQTPADTEVAEDAEAGPADEDAEGVTPDFEVTDRRGAIVADRVGVRFRLDGEEAEFRWDEIAAVEIDTPRFGRRFSVTVYTPERRWYDAQVEAPSRGTLKEWTAQLDAVLDRYFEDDAEEGEPAEAVEEPEGTDEAADEAGTAEPAGADAAEAAEVKDAEPEDTKPAADSPSASLSKDEVQDKAAAADDAGTGTEAAPARKS